MYYFRKINPGVSAVAQQDQQCLCSTRTQVPSPARHSGLKHLALLHLWYGSQLRIGSDPRPGNFICQEAAKKEKKKKFKSTMLNKKMSQWASLSFPDFKGNVSIAYTRNVSLTCFIDITYQVKEIPFYVQSAQGIIISLYFYQIPFASTQMILWFFFFCLLTW